MVFLLFACVKKDVCVCAGSVTIKVRNQHLICTLTLGHPNPSSPVSFLLELLWRLNEIWGEAFILFIACDWASVYLGHFDCCSQPKYMYKRKKCDSLRVPHTLQEDREEERGERGRGEDGVTYRTVSFLVGSKRFTWCDTRQRCSTKIYRLYFLTVLVFRKTWLLL